MKKNIPNILSLFRISLSVLLFFITNDIVLFFIIYTIAGLSDIIDGYIARKYHLETSIGAKLDSLADFLFLLVSLLRMVLSYHLTIPKDIWIYIGIIAIIRFINFCITKIKFQQWGMLHTIGNKLTGCIIFFICPIVIITNQFPFIIIIIPFLSAIEETIILLSSSNYNPNINNIFTVYKKIII